jgi:hypothetical protein
VAAVCVEQHLGRQVSHCDTPHWTSR